jgi:hypothetical protein
MYRVISEIEKRLADGIYMPEQEAEQMKRLRILYDAQERGGDDGAFYADMMFVAGTTD